MPGFGGASTSHGAMGQSGAGYAFNDGLGLSTGKTWYGNAAFGPAGGMAQGYGTGNGSGFSGLSNLRALDGSPYGNPYGTPKPTGGLAALPRPTPRPQVRPTVKPPVVQPPVQPPPVQRPTIPSIPPNAIMYPFRGTNFINAWPSPPQYTPASQGGGAAGLGGYGSVFGGVSGGGGW